MKQRSITALARGARLAAAAAVAVALAAAGAAGASAQSYDVLLTDDEHEVQGVSIYGSGQFRLGFGGDVTSDLNTGSTSAQVQAALNALPSIAAGGGSVSVKHAHIGGSHPVSNYNVYFDGGPLARTDVPLLTASEGTTPLDTNQVKPLLVFRISRPGLNRNEDRVDYTLRVTNSDATPDPLPHTSATVGDELFCAGARPEKSWDPALVPNIPDSFSFQWRANGAVIAGATSPAYTVAAADAGKAIQCLVRGENQNAALTFASLPAAVVDPQPATAPPAPASATVAGSRPTIAGTGQNLRTCTAPANWPQPPDATYEFQWLRNGVPIPGAINQASPTTSEYTPVEADSGRVLQCMATATNDGGSLVGVSNGSNVGTVTSPPNLFPAQTPHLIADPVIAEIELPAGQGTSAKTVTGSGWACSSQPPTLLQHAKATCVATSVRAPGQSFSNILIQAVVGADAPDLAVARATVSGGGAAGPATSAPSQFVFNPVLPFDIVDFEAAALDELKDDYTQAGGHPHTAFSRMVFPLRRSSLTGPAIDLQLAYAPIEYPRNIVVDIPPGFVGNPLAAPKVCPSIQDTINIPSTCPPESVVGGITIVTDLTTPTDWPIYALEAPHGSPAMFGFADAGDSKTQYTFEAELRPEDNYSIRVAAAKASTGVGIKVISVTLCGFGASTRLPEGLGNFLLFDRCRSASDVDANPKPFFTNPTRCSGPLTTTLSVDTWGEPNVFRTKDFTNAAITDCDQVPFTPTVAMAPTSSVADGASGLNASISIPADGLEDPDGVSQAHLKKTVVELPDGMSVNPSAATGLQGCTDAQLGLRTDSEPQCPDGSKIAAVSVTTPVLEETLSGVMVLRTPRSTDPQSGEMFRMALIVRNDERGILVKLPGSAVANPQTGKIVATFDDNPQLPIGTVDVAVKGGARGVLAMPQDCGPISTKATLTPWSGGADAVSSTASNVGGNCGERFAPALTAGMDTQAARGSGKFSFKFSRQDGEQWLRGLTANLPKGLLASVKHVDLCSNAQANAGACPVGSKIGIVDAKAGSGNPFVLEQKGEVFLTEGYKGGPYGLAVKIRPIAGPFRGAMELSPIVVRQAIHVDRKTAQVTAVSDPFPLIHHGVPLRAREVTVLVDRPQFMLNPSDCSAKQVGADILSAQGAIASPVNHFQAVGCKALRFKPRLGLALKGRRQVRTGGHPAIRAVVRQNGVGEAGIAKTVVRLPKSLALDPDNAQALCEFDQGTKPDLENHCPKGSIVGRARAKTPLLKDDLAGNVYFVKNVRIDKQTGNEIRTLPMIVVALRGEIAVNLVGESSTTRSGKLVNTFADVPDAPISQFNLNIRGGRNGILAVTRTRRSNINLCAKPRGHIAEADIDGHNGRRHDFNIRMNTPCPKRRQSAAAICRKRTNSKPALRRCVRRVKAQRAKAAKRKAAARRAAAKRRAGGGRS